MALSHNDLARIIDSHQRMVWRYLRLLGADLALADDLTQETFLKLLRGPFEERGDDKTAAFLRLCAKRLFLDYLRKEARQVEIEDIDKIDALWKQYYRDGSGDERIEALKTCFEGLGDDEKGALRLQYVENSKTSGIANVIGKSEAATRMMLSRARVRLRECVQRKLGLEAEEASTPAKG